MTQMSDEQRIAHDALLKRLRVTTVVFDEYDEDESEEIQSAVAKPFQPNWREKDRPLSPQERVYLWRQKK